MQTFFYFFFWMTELCDWVIWIFESVLCYSYSTVLNDLKLKLEKPWCSLEYYEPNANGSPQSGPQEMVLDCKFILANRILSQPPQLTGQFQLVFLVFHWIPQSIFLRTKKPELNACNALVRAAQQSLPLPGFRYSMEHWLYQVLSPGTPRSQK